LFITFEGIEGCGKSTQAKRLSKRLRQKNIPLILTLEPGGTRIGKDIRKILLDSRNQNLVALAELFLYAADRAQHVKEMIRPALEQNKWVICDRFFDATTVYQGFARGQDKELIKILNDKAALGIKPDITFLVDCPARIGIERALKRNKNALKESQDRFEKEKMDFHEAVRNGYLSMAREEPERFVVVDGMLSIDEIEESIFKYIRSFLPESHT
jgi:dTMP kinase